MFIKILFWAVECRRRENQSFAESQEQLCGDDYDTDTSKRPITYTLIQIWGFFETLILVVLLITKTKDIGDNFLDGFCSHSFCDRIVFKAIVLKIVSSILLTLGSIHEITVLMLPWFVINVFGIYPLWEVVLSSYVTFGEFRSLLLDNIDKWTN
ncbi:uncharacterized protein LOC116347844 [Contarinia nasturtii]|uniref:uncharacterized protein LOC116347844 n=1 Tax=Contarinia nasturtii TaxID=265458 RepID=UPI0012D41A51|nr:uncharacterized protein LOC116347844 [Contarinia nasturtii]